MNVLDLFAGQKSMKAPAEDLGMNYFSVELLPELEPDLVANVADLSSKDIPFKPDIIWASPPCTKFSVASYIHYWNRDHTPKKPEAQEALDLVIHTLDLIDELEPQFWFMENPTAKLRMLIPGDRYLLRREISYCRYNDPRRNMKPTDIWTNSMFWIPRPKCRPGHPDHNRAPRQGSNTGTQALSAEEAGKVPYDLLYEILVSCLIPTPTETSGKASPSNTEGKFNV